MPHGKVSHSLDVRTPGSYNGPGALRRQREEALRAWLWMGLLREVVGRAP